MAIEPGKNGSLTSWKEIASYLGCDQRTCYRWEKTLGLPVHRMEGAHKSRVYARKEELDAWRKSRESTHPFDMHKPGSAPAWKTAFLFLALILAAAALFFGFRKLLSPQEPADFRINKGTLVVLNEKGGKLWRFETGVENLLGNQAYHEHFQVKRNIPSEIVAHPYLIIKDITGDGRKEVLFTVKTEDGYREGVVFCFDRRGREMWRFRAGRPIRFGRQDYADFVIFGFGANDLDNDGRQEVIVISHGRGFFPTQLAVLNSDGQLHGEFWNSGQITDFALVDLERDGRKEIIFSGMNNEYKKGCLIVFDTARISGGSPQSVEKYISPTLSAGTERFYVLFPRTDLDMSEFPIEMVVSFEVLSNDLILVTMDKSRIIYELGFDLAPRIARTSHPFEQKHAVAVREGRIKSVLDDAYFENLKLGILYWNGREWTGTPSPVISP
jgi:outer membrane protein assembly factor BamB